MSHYFRLVKINQFLAAVSLVAFVMCVPATTNAQSATKQAGSSAKAQGSATKQGSSSTQGSATKVAKIGIDDYGNWRESRMTSSVRSCLVTEESSIFHHYGSAQILREAGVVVNLVPLPDTENRCDYASK